MPWKLTVSNARGAQAETQALRFLKKQGLTLLTTNFACRAGELDLVMLDADTLVFVEVRARSTERFGSAVASIDATKISRLRKAAAVFLQRHRQHAYRHCRFDAITVNNESNQDSQGQLEWVQGIF